MKHGDLIDPCNMVVRGKGGDIAIILSCNVEKLENSHLWYDFEVDYYNSRQYNDIIVLINAFSGLDFAPAFFTKGKIPPIQLKQKNEKFVDEFTNLGDFPLNTDTLYILETFTYHLQGHVKQNDEHEVIKLPFVEKNDPLKRKISRIKNISTMKKCSNSTH